MLSEYSARDRELTQEFHEALLTHFCQGFDDPLQQLLYECSFGFAPNSSGERTFFIIAATVDDTEEILETCDRLIAKVADLMPGISKVALCFQPIDEQLDPSSESPRFLFARVVDVPQIRE
ncbi:MAG: hypothetical protein J7641_23275 [Cyanobacteria bacterium SID2]|nr:hypothetical protein [Cyanobacteria bacterium SID2]MBP0005969.1 hypothetical protein [Cyanobacteria bacterium SBC]